MITRNRWNTRKYSNKQDLVETIDYLARAEGRHSTFEERFYSFQKETSRASFAGLDNDLRGCPTGKDNHVQTKKQMRQTVSPIWSPTLSCIAGDIVFDIGSTSL